VLQRQREDFRAVSNEEIDQLHRKERFAFRVPRFAFDVALLSRPCGSQR
jgi:hypothetical protein